MISPNNVFQLFVKAGKAWSDDYAPSMGAAISYYTVFSLAPLLVSQDPLQARRKLRSRCSYRMTGALLTTGRP